MSNIKEPVSGDKPPGNKAPVERKEPTRLHMLTRLLWLCFYSVAMVIGGNVMLALPQIQEGLWAFDDGQGRSVQRQVIFVLAFLYWAATAWYVARLTLGREFPNDYVGSTSTFVNRVAEWLPRVLSLAACLPMALFLLGTGRHYLLAIVLIAVSILFVGFTWRRRKWFNLEAHHSYYGYFARLERSSLLTLRIAFLLPHVLLVLILLAPISFPRGVGAPALMLMAIGTWTLVGGMLLSYWPRTKGWVTLNWVPVVLFVGLSFFNDNHPIDWQAGSLVSASGPIPAALAGPAPAASTPADKRPQLRAHYLRWIQEHPVGDPVYLVASAGGASRASYWGGVVLGRMEDEARAAQKRFGSNVFMMSGISGGSVGLAAYATALRAWPSTSAGAQPPCFRLAMDQFLGEDVLSTVGAYMLFPDLLQRFLPAIPLSQRIDRSRGLEEVWTQDWASLVKQPPASCGAATHGADTLWRQPLAGALAAGPGLPTVMLNAARLEDSRRVLQSNVALDLPDADDLFGVGFEARARSVSLAGAAHNSARFPLVSPPGSVRGADGTHWGHLGDGGYHEVTGTAVLADVVEELIELGCLRRDPAREEEALPARLFARSQCGHGAAAASTPDGKVTESRVVVVLLDSVPKGHPKGWLRDIDGHPRVWPHADRTEILRGRIPLQPAELVGPISGLLMHSSQEARSNAQRLASLAGIDPYSVIEIRLPRFDTLREPSMNWQLDEDSRREMMCAADPVDRAARPVLSVKDDKVNCYDDAYGFLPRKGGAPANEADRALMCNLERLRAWIDHKEGTPRPPVSNCAFVSASR